MGNEIEALQQVLKQDPSNFQARRELAVLLLNNGFNKEAEGNLKYLIKYFPEDAELYYNLGIVHEKLKDFAAARRCYEKAVTISPQEDFYYNLGEVLVELKEWDEAIKTFKKVLETDAKDGNCYFNLGICFFNKDEKNLALDYFQKAVEINPNDTFAYFYLGYIYQKDGLTNFAVENYKKVLSLAPDYSWAYFNLGSIAFNNGNTEEAGMYLQKTLDCNPADTEAYKLLVKLHLKQGETEDIAEILHSRLEDDENGDLFYCLAHVYKYRGDFDNYRTYLKRAIENPYTLTFPHDLVKKEFKSAEEKDIEDIADMEEYDGGEEMPDGENSELESYEEEYTEQ